MFAPTFNQPANFGALGAGSPAAFLANPMQNASFGGVQGFNPSQALGQQGLFGGAAATNLGPAQMQLMMMENMLEALLAMLMSGQGMGQDQGQGEDSSGYSPVGSGSGNGNSYSPSYSQPSNGNSYGGGGGSSAPSSSGGSSPSQSSGSGSASAAGDAGSVTSSGPSAPGTEALLQHAESMVGLQEGRDRAKIQEVTGRSGINPSTTPWCAAFAINLMKEHGVLDTAGLSNPNYCPTIKNWAQDKGIWGNKASYQPKAGDAILFDWNKDGTMDHIGIVEKVANGKVYTIEGNSSNSVKKNSYDAGSSSIGGYVSSGKKK
jgi:hypothetical protein